MRLAHKTWIIAILLWSFIFMGCDAINPAGEGDLADYTCEGCHTNRNALSNVIDALNLEPPHAEEEAPG